MRFLLLLLIPFYSYCQTYGSYTQPVKIQVQENPWEKMQEQQIRQNEQLQENLRNAANVNAANNATHQAGQSAASANNYQEILIDRLKGQVNKYQYVAIKRISGWAVIGNFKEISEQIKIAKKYILVNDIVGDIKKERKINESKLFEPEIIDSYFSNPNVIFLEFSREALSTYDRLSRLVLKNSDDIILFEGEFKNKGYIEILKPLLTDYQLTKEDAKNKLIELKEYIDLGIITQEEFEKKAVFLKKILLDN